MHLLIVSATPFEIQPLTNHLKSSFEKISDSHFKKNKLEIRLLITGVGMAHTAFSLGHVLAKNQFNLAINAGIAGAFDRSLNIGDVVQVVTEQFGDLGVEEKDGSFTDVFEMELFDKNQPPFEDGLLRNEGAAGFGFLPKCKGLTVNKVHGTNASANAASKKYGADIESMEGAAFFLACKLSEVPFLQVRSISNYVEARNRELWDLPKAIKNLNNILIEIINVFASNQ
ncbi:MAG TPA: futalosine hydrolase [Bacteroidetes bacterium]|nr:futalosine hydrolase [Bacteroidota bacterium]